MEVQTKEVTVFQRHQSGITGFQRFSNASLSGISGFQRHLCQESLAKERVEEIAGEKVFVMNSGARNAEQKFVLTRGRVGGTATPGEESI